MRRQTAKRATPCIAVLRCWFEGNSFSPATTTLADFQACEWLAGDEARAFYRGTDTEMGAVVDFAAAHAACPVRFLRCAAAPPGGPIDAGSWDELRHQLLDPLADLQAAGAVAGVYLSLHGAIVCQGGISADRTLIEAVRALVGRKVPLAVTFDLHANLTETTARAADIVLGCKTYPRTDLHRTAARAMHLLQAAMRGGCHPLSAIVPAQAILPSHHIATDLPAMRRLHQTAAELARRPGVLDATPYCGYAFADAPETGASASVCVDGDGALAEALAQELAQAIRTQRAQFAAILPGPGGGLAAAQETVARIGGPVAVLEVSDNPRAGGSGDAPGLFRALLDAQPRCETVFSFFHDPGVVAQAFAAGVGARLKARLGGRVAATFGAPVEFEGAIERLTDGVFVNEGPLDPGAVCSWGRSAVLRAGRVRVVVTESCRAPSDPAWCRLHGIDLAALGLWCVKAGNDFRAAFTGRMQRIIDVDTPGPAALELATLPYRFAQRAWLAPA